MKSTTGYDYTRPAELISKGDEAMVKIDQQTGAVTLHPALVAYGTADEGWLAIHGWQGSLGYQRGQGTFGNDQCGIVCIGDAICKAIDRGEIPLRPKDELPQELTPGWSQKLT